MSSSAYGDFVYIICLFLLVICIKNIVIWQKILRVEFWFTEQTIFYTALRHTPDAIHQTPEENSANSGPALLVPGPSLSH